MRRTIFIMLGVVAVAGFLQGCETVKGAQKDISNTAVNIQRISNEMLEGDKDFADKYW